MIMYNLVGDCMKPLCEYVLEIKKSKFIALLYEVSSDNEVKEILSDLKAEHKKARHIPYAYRLVNTAKKSDDKEPSNTAGLPILNILERESLTNELVVVIRYFGGTKLGAGPLLRAYAGSTNEVVKKYIEEKTCL